MFDISGTMWLVYILFRLRCEEHLAAVDVADVQPDFPDDVSERVAAAFERHDRRALDSNALWHGSRRESGAS
jgi:hypothetical protein